MEKIRRITIVRGEKEFTEDDIAKDSELTELCDVLVKRAAISNFIPRINKERGTIVIKTNFKRDILQVDLIGVSATLYFEFNNR